MSSVSSQTADFDSQWTLPFEVVVLIAEAGLERYKRDFRSYVSRRAWKTRLTGCRANRIMNAGRLLLPPRTSSLPLGISKSLTAHLLPRLYRSVRIHTHTQPISFLRGVKESSVQLIQRFILDIQYVQAPEVPSYDIIERLPQDDEDDRLRALERQNHTEVVEAIAGVKKRLGGGRGDKGESDLRVFGVARTSPGAVLIAECLCFPIVDLSRRSDPSTLYTTRDLMESTAVPSIRRLRIRTDLSWFQYPLSDVISSLPLKHHKDLIVIVDIDSRNRSPVTRELNDELRRLSSYAAEIVTSGSVKKMVFRLRGQPDDVGTHLFCPGQPGAPLKSKVEGVVYVTCAEGECPFREGA